MNNNKKVVSKNQKGKPKREQPRKDSRAKRVNFDNARDSKFMKDIEKETKCTSKSNDVSWYAKNEELLRSAASLPYSSTTGLFLPWADTSSNIYQQSVPGVLSMSWTPMIGGSNDDPINAAANSLYSFVVHANSRNTKYNAPDMMQVVLAGADVFSAIAHAVRAYGTMKRFDQRNAYLPQGLITAMGFDYADLQSNLAQMWFDINEIIARATQIWIPNDMPILQRWFWMNSNIYMDAGSVKAQYYVFTPNAFYGYDETYNNNGGALSLIPDDAKSETQFTRFTMTAGSNHTWAEYKTILDTMISQLLNSEDRGIMFGDILKAYGSDKIYAITPIPADYTVEPVYDPEVLSQIENIDVYSYTPFAIAQNTNLLRIYTDWLGKNATTPPDIAATVYPTMWCRDVEVLNMHGVEVPTPAQTMVATRLKCMGTKTLVKAENQLFPIPETCGTEVINELNVIEKWKDDNGQAKLQVQYFQVQGAVSNLNTRIMINHNVFDWMPWLYAYSSGLVPTTGTQIPAPSVMAAIGDYDNYTIIDKVSLQKMNTTALYSLFGVPVL